MIQRQSEEVFLVDHGSLYVALQTLEDRKWIRAKWGVSENNRKARFYSITAKGREQLAEKTGEWRRLTRAIGLILDSGSGPQGEKAEICSDASAVLEILQKKLSYLLAVVGVALVALAASVVPAARAAGIDPMRALRME